MIAAARIALASNDARGALDLLLAAWRATPATALAEAIEVVGAFAARDVHAPQGTSAEDREQMWLEEARRGDPVMRQRLVETLADTYEPLAKIARAKVLAETTTDPRIAMAIAALATVPRMPYTDSVSTVWNPLFQMLARGGDPRVRQVIARAPWATILRYKTPKQREAFLARLAKYDAQLARALPEPPRLAYEDEQILLEIIALASAPASTEARDRDLESALLAAIHAAPNDTGPRAIYADWLQERGNPRGEFIALQLAHPRAVPPPIRTRLRELLAQHRSKWLGDLEPHIKYDTFGGGFLEEVTLHQDGDGVYIVPPPHSAWSTVRKITGGIPASDAHPMPILAIASDIDHRGMHRLATLANPPPLVSLEWNGTTFQDSAVVSFAALVRKLPTLRRFSIRGSESEALAWAWRGSTIRELSVEAPSRRLGHWLELAVVEKLERIHVKHDSWQTSLDASGAFIAKQDYSGGFEYVMPHLEEALDRPVVAAHVSHLDIRVAAKHEWKLPVRRRMASLLARHPRWITGELYGYIPPA